MTTEYTNFDNGGCYLKDGMLKNHIDFGSIGFCSLRKVNVSYCLCATAGLRGTVSSPYYYPESACNNVKVWVSKNDFSHGM